MGTTTVAGGVKGASPEARVVEMVAVDYYSSSRVTRQRTRSRCSFRPSNWLT